MKLILVWFSSLVIMKSLRHTLSQVFQLHTQAERKESQKNEHTALSAM